MQNAVWKFSAIAGVLGICLLAVLQVQESLSDGSLDELAENGVNQSQTESSQSSADNTDAQDDQTETLSAVPNLANDVPTLADNSADETPIEKSHSQTTENSDDEVPSVFDDNSIAGIDLNNPVPEEELESESIVFDEKNEAEPKEPRTLVINTKNLQPIPETAEIKTATDEGKAEETPEININGIELASNEEPQSEKESTKGNNGPKLFTQLNPAEEEPIQLETELTDKAVPLDENKKNTTTPYDKLDTEDGLTDFNPVFTKEDTPEVVENLFPEEETPANKPTEELNEPPTEELQDEKMEPLLDESTLTDKDDEDLFDLENELETESDESLELQPIPEKLEPIEDEFPESSSETKPNNSPYLQNLSDDSDSFDDENKEEPVQLLTGEKNEPDLADEPVKEDEPKLITEPEEIKTPVKEEFPAEFEDNPENFETKEKTSPVVRGAQRPHLKIEKIAPKNSVLGKPLIYSILIKNVGERTAHKVVVEDQIPKGTKLTGTIPQAEWIDNKLIWNFKELKPGEKQKIAIRVIPQKPGTVGSVATVRFATEIAAETIVSAPSVTLEVKLPKVAQVGQNVTLQFTIKNSSNVAAKNVIIRNILPKMFRHTDGDDLEYEVGTMAAGETKDVSLNLSASEIGEGFNHAIATVDGNVSDESKTDISVKGQRLELVRRGPKTRFKGKEIIYTNTVKNKSGNTISGAKIIEQIPEGLEFKAASQGGEYDRKKRIVSWDINSINPDESQEYKVKLVAHETGTKSSHVSVIDTDGTRSVVNSQTKVKGYSALSLNVSSLDAPLNIGETVAVKVRAFNRGTTAATNVRLSILIPPELKIVNVDAPIKFQKLGNQVHLIKIPEIKPKSNFEVNLALKVISSGEVRLNSSIESDQMKKPLSREEPVLILDEQ